MPIKVSKFVVQHETKPEEPLKKAPKPETIRGEDDFILLTKDGTLKVKRSQYVEDMMGVSEDREYINTKNNKKE